MVREYHGRSSQFRLHNPQVKILKVPALLMLGPFLFAPLDKKIFRNIIYNYMNFKPLSNHLFIEPIEEENTTKSGIVLPDTVEKEKPIKGKIIAVGPGKLNEKGEIILMSVKIGDVVLFKKYGPDEIEIEGKKYLVGDEEDILAILE